MFTAIQVSIRNAKAKREAALAEIEQGIADYFNHPDTVHSAIIPGYRTRACTALYRTGAAMGGRVLASREKAVAWLSERMTNEVAA